MEQYLNGLRTILDRGFDSKPARENMPPTKVYNDLQMRFDLTGNKLPVITTKKMPIRSITAELLCFMAGRTDVRDYEAMGCSVWWDNAYNWNIPNKKDISIEDYKDGSYVLPNSFYDLGRIYAAQWRDCKGRRDSNEVVSVNLKKDQLVDMIESIIKTPESRYHVISTWSPTEMNSDLVSQPNCHVYFQVTCRELDKYERLAIYDSANKLYVIQNDEDIEDICNRADIPKYAIRSHLTQRSCDMFLGVPFNITSYSLFTHILARITNTVAEEFVWNGVNCHIYGNHLEQINEQLSRAPEEVPTLTIDESLQTLNDFESLVDSPIGFKKYFKTLFKLDNYRYHPPIKGDLSVGL